MRVFTAGHKMSIYESDSRSRTNPARSIMGLADQCNGKKYFVTSSWNAFPDTAFTMEGEFFQQKSVDEYFIWFPQNEYFCRIGSYRKFHFPMICRRMLPWKRELVSMKPDYKNTYRMFSQKKNVFFRTKQKTK